MVGGIKVMHLEIISAVRCARHHAGRGVPCSWPRTGVCSARKAAFARAAVPGLYAAADRPAPPRARPRERLREESLTGLPRGVNPFADMEAS